MSNKMLIDAAHPEETRVVVLRGNRVEEFDFEAADRQQLRGNIYLAKVTRVEPSLQAAFVEYGGNRHGFLAFSEIHPDYYQIPVADRQALLEEHARDVAEEAAQEEREDAAAAAADSASEADSEDDTAPRAEADESSGPESIGADAVREPFIAEELHTESDRPAGPADGASEVGAPHSEDDRPSGAPVESVENAESVESVGAEDAMEEVPERRKPRPRQYKIQEVIKRRQVLLVQVVKEERGNKGAALTTYLSLAGRYSVLMPNTARGGGISRKITNAADRKRLKSVADELEVPQGMGVILRTAGASRTKAEIKRDFEYLLRLWENVRELTLRSTAPKLVYEEGSLIKRSIRDLYSREIEQILVAGDDAYREAKEFMRMLMPSHARYVQQYREDTPIFSRNSVETQLDAMFSPQVTLRSGGYIVINQTEALVAIDVNSGRSTREHSIEDTAHNTNLEAAEEIARQLRLRDLAGLIVIDFIDMEEKRNNRSVERKLKDALKVDRARLQVGHISHFGLLEMSRQRIRTGVLESSTVHCSHCRGTGQVRSISSLSLQILRAVEDHLLRQSGHHLIVRTRPEVAVYVLNQKRRHLAQLEARFGLSITVLAEAPGDGAGYQIERGESVGERPIIAPPIAMSAAPALEEEPDFEEDAPVDASPEIDVESEEAGEGGEGQARRRSRRRRRGGSGREGRDGRPQEARSHEPRPQNARRPEDAEERSEPEGDEGAARGEERPFDADAEAGRNGIDAEGRRRRRGRRGGRRRGRGREGGEHRETNGNHENVSHAGSADADDAPPLQGEPTYDSEPDTAYVAEGRSMAELALAREDRDVSDVDLGSNGQAEEVAALQESVKGEYDGEEHSRTGAFVEAGATLGEPAEEDGRPRRSGWWNRRSFF